MERLSAFLRMKAWTLEKDGKLAGTSAASSRSKRRLITYLIVTERAEYAHGSVEERAALPDYS